MTVDATSRTYGSTDLCKLVGITYRQLDFWMRKGIVTPSAYHAKQSGESNRYAFGDALRVAVIAELVHAGLTLEAAALHVADLLIPQPDPFPLSTRVALRIDLLDIRARLLRGTPLRRALRIAK